MDDKPAKKTEQEILLEIQMRSKDKARIPDILTIVTGAAVICALSVLMFVFPDSDFSEQERRALQQFPKISSEGKFLDRLADGKFTAEIATYYSDQFPFRDAFVGIKGAAEIALLKGENDGVIIGKEGYLITKDPMDKSFNEARDYMNKKIDEISAFADVMDKMGKIPVTLAVAGRSADVLGIYLPATYPTTFSDNLLSLFVGLADYAQNINRLELAGPIRQLIERGNSGQLYYKTDHHWTTLGAYYAYVEIMKSFKDASLEPLPLSAFTREIASDRFYGTTWAKAGAKWVMADVMEYFRYEGDDNFTTSIVDTGKSFKGFYDRSYLETNDKYGSFLSGNNFRVDVAKTQNPGEPPRPKMLLMKDSFAHSVVPFLAIHFDLVILDWRYDQRLSTSKLVFDEKIDRVLFLHNIGNLIEGAVYGVPGEGAGMLQYGAESALESYRMDQYPIKKIYINGNPINEYAIIVPTDENDGRKYYMNAAESLRDMIAERAGVELEIVKSDDISALGKAIAFTNEGLPAVGFVKIATEGDSLVFRCNIGSDSPGYAASLFMDKYIRKATGSFNFGDDFIYSDTGDAVIMIRPGQ
ncbi:MAG: DHHW family protein [Oscillospiraceae bacterium]|nr:DHHW family protein [Oscillospiraceae bacterium]